MPPTAKLVARLAADYPNLTFTVGTDDRWDGQRTINYTVSTPECALLHELAHALLGHTGYDLDIDLLKMERAAWDYARRELAPVYGVTINADDAEDALDTYRDWLHNRSLCPDCHVSGMQLTGANPINRSSYRCLACARSWTANEAKHSALRRYRQPAAA